ncbi:hypothetical protein GBAR_LOCUS22705, partial [Geodia barretti]
NLQPNSILKLVESYVQNKSKQLRNYSHPGAIDSLVQYHRLLLVDDYSYGRWGTAGQEYKLCSVTKCRAVDCVTRFGCVCSTREDLSIGSYFLQHGTCSVLAI